jgi:hypothetical protein
VCVGLCVKNCKVDSGIESAVLYLNKLELWKTVYVYYVCSIGLSFVDCGMHIIERCTYSRCFIG